MTNEEKINLVRQYIDSYNNFDIEGLIANLDEEINFQNISNGVTTHETNGLEAFRQQAAEAANLFSEREQKIENISFSGDSCEVSIDYTGKLAVALSDELKAGETINLKGKSIFEFRNNRIYKIQDIS